MAGAKAPCEPVRAALGNSLTVSDFIRWLMKTDDSAQNPVNECNRDLTPTTLRKEHNIAGFTRIPARNEDAREEIKHGVDSALGNHESYREKFSGRSCFEFGGGPGGWGMRARTGAVEHTTRMRRS